MYGSLHLKKYYLLLFKEHIWWTLSEVWFININSTKTVFTTIDYDEHLPELD